MNYTLITQYHTIVSILRCPLLRSTYSEKLWNTLYLIFHHFISGRLQLHKSGRMNNWSKTLIHFSITLIVYVNSEGLLGNNWAHNSARKVYYDVCEKFLNEQNFVIDCWIFFPHNNKVVHTLLCCIQTRYLL